jgi:formamidopyrimidine-DNA glycosylase
MPELAEVEFYRKQWEPGLGAKVLAVELHPEKRIFRGTDATKLVASLTGARLLRSEARGKQMAFIFSGGAWLALHLGMTGKLRTEPADFAPGKHDHLVLRQKRAALVFSDPRLFGRVLFWIGKGQPEWWSTLPPALTSDAFTREVLAETLLRHRKLPLKAALLLQKRFPGVGNWMADEILWQARLHPKRASGDVAGAELTRLWKSIRHVCAGALEHVGKDFSDPPSDWLFHQRWGRSGQCPRDGKALERETVGGRTTAWCARCQPK